MNEGMRNAVQRYRGESQSNVCGSDGHVPEGARNLGRNCPKVCVRVVALSVRRVVVVTCHGIAVSDSREQTEK